MSGAKSEKLRETEQEDKAMKRRHAFSIVVLVSSLCPAYAKLDNKPERLEWLQDAGFGMFIHWSMDSQIGSVISHSMAGASDDYLDWFIRKAANM